MTDNIDNYGDNFQQKSKYIRNNLPRHFLDWENKPKTYKKYLNPIKTIKLPPPDFDKTISFWKVIVNRQSMRKFSQEPLDLNLVGLLLYAISGITREFPQYAFRTIPSAGGLFPIETYVIINNLSECQTNF